MLKSPNCDLDPGGTTALQFEPVEISLTWGPKQMNAAVRSCTAAMTIVAAGVIYSSFLTASYAEGVNPAVKNVEGNQCWSSEALRMRKGEAEIRKLVPEAYREPPDRKLVALPPLPLDRQKVLRRVDLPSNDRQLIALTFDLCEQPYEVAGYQGTIVDFLRHNRVKATFFAGGKWMLSHRERTQQLIMDPLFEVGNHTWEHRNLRLLTGQDLKNEILNSERSYEEVRGELAGVCWSSGNPTNTSAKIQEHQSLFRFPFGACNATSLHAVGELGLTAVQWDVSSGDPTRSLTPDEEVKQVVDNVKAGSIVLFHANGRGWSTPAALPSIVRVLKQRGFEFVTVSELMKAPGAKPVYADTCFDSKPGDTDKYDKLARHLDEIFQRFKAAHGGRLSGVPIEGTSSDAEELPWAKGKSE